MDPMDPMNESLLTKLAERRAALEGGDAAPAEEQDPSGSPTQKLDANQQAVFNVFEEAGEPGIAKEVAQEMTEGGGGGEFAGLKPIPRPIPPPDTELPPFIEPDVKEDIREALVAGLGAGQDYTGGTPEPTIHRKTDEDYSKKAFSDAALRILDGRAGPAVEKWVLNNYHLADPNDENAKTVLAQLRGNRMDTPMPKVNIGLPPAGAVLGPLVGAGQPPPPPDAPLEDQIQYLYDDTLGPIVGANMPPDPIRDRVVVRPIVGAKVPPEPPPRRDRVVVEPIDPTGGMGLPREVEDAALGDPNNINEDEENPDSNYQGPEVNQLLTPTSSQRWAIDPGVAGDRETAMLRARGKRYNFQGLPKELAQSIKGMEAPSISGMESEDTPAWSYAEHTNQLVRGIYNPRGPNPSPARIQWLEALLARDQDLMPPPLSRGRSKVRMANGGGHSSGTRQKKKKKKVNKAKSKSPKSITQKVKKAVKKKKAKAVKKAVIKRVTKAHSAGKRAKSGAKRGRPTKKKARIAKSSPIDNQAAVIVAAPAPVVKLVEKQEDSLLARILALEKKLAQKARGGPRKVHFGGASNRKAVTPPIAVVGVGTRSVGKKSLPQMVQAVAQGVKKKIAKKPLLPAVSKIKRKVVKKMVLRRKGK